MLHFNSILLLTLFNVVLAQSGPTLQSTSQSFLDNKIVPDVIPAFQPSALLKVEYTDPSTQKTIDVIPGVLLSTNQTVNEPTFSVVAQDLSQFSGTYVLAMVDPDAPTPQNTSLAEVRHLIAGDLKVDTSTGRLVNSSVPISSYISPGPPPGSRPHRYTILLFQQSDSFDTTAPTLFNSSVVTGFNVSSFAQTLSLGNPVAGVFFFEGPAGPTPVPSSSGSPSSSPVITAVTRSPGSSTGSGSVPSGSPTGGSSSNSAISQLVSSFMLSGVMVLVQVALYGYMLP